MEYWNIGSVLHRTEKYRDSCDKPIVGGIKPMSLKAACCNMSYKLRDAKNAFLPTIAFHLAEFII
jgi:hypothetical protein